MDTISSKTSIMTDNDNDNVNISSNRNKYQDSGSQSFDAKVKTFSEAGEIENLNVQKTPALCVSPSEDIMLKWNDKEEQITEENISGDFDIRKDDKSNNKHGSQHKLTAIDSKKLKDCKVVLEDSDSDNLNSMEIEKSELLRDKEIFATSSIENSASVIKKTLKDPNAMLEIPTYIDITDSDCQMNDDLFMSIKTDNNDLLKDKKGLKLQLESPDIIKMKKTNESEKMKKTQFNVEDDLLTSPEDEEKLLDDEPILIESDDPFPEIINITEDDDFSESTPNLARNRSVSEHKLKNALIGLETDLLAGSNLSPQKCNESDNRPTSDTDDISQSDNSFFSDIDVVLPEDSDVTKNNDTDLLLEENNIALKTDTITAPQTMLTEKKSNRAQLTTTANDEETTISTSNNEPSSDVPHCLNIDSVSNLSKMDQDISLTVSNVLTIEIDKHQKTDVHTSYTAESNNQVVKDSTILGDLKEDSLCSDTTVRNGTIKPDDAFPSTSKDSQSDTLKVDDTIPSTLKLKEQKDEPLKLDACTSNKSIPVLDSTQSIEDKIQTVQEPIASTSKTDEDVQDTSDSLGLLAELSRMMGDDEDQDEDDDGDNGDDEEEFDPDYESSNQLTAEQSEDSNTRIEGDGKEPKENDEIKDRPFEFTMDKDEQLDENTNDANENDDVDEVTVEAQDLIDIESKLSDTSDVEENKSKDLPGEKSEKSPGAVGSDVVELDSEDETKDNSDVTTVNLPAGIDVIASRSSVVSTDIRVKEGEIIISGIPKPAALKVARLNTAEVSIKTTKLPALEVFNLDSDEDMDVDKQVVAEDTEDTAEASDAHLKHRKCVNEACPHLTNVFYVADSSSMSFYNAKKCGYVCEICAEAVVRRNERLIEGIRNFEDLVLLDLGKDLKESIEVLDSDSDDGVDSEDFAKELIGEEGAKLLEEQLADIFNEQWDKYKMDARILKSVDSLKIEMAELERQSKEVDQMLKECQTSTDNFRNELYETFKPDIKQLPPLTICDMYQLLPHETHTMETRLGKRRMSSSVEAPAKRKADGDKSIKNDPTCGIGEKADDDNTDITVVQLSTENAPPDLPPVGELERPTLRPGMPIYAMRNVFGTWGRAHIIEVNGASNSPYSMCRIKFDKSQKNVYKSLSARNLAYCEPANARMTIGTRVIALFQGSAEDVKDDKQREKFYSGIVAEVPNPVNSFRYLIFFDDGYAQYASHADTRLVCEYSSQVWEEVHPFSRLFVKEYLFNYPQRPMVRLKANETIKTEWKNKWWPSKVVKVDASLVLVQFLMGEYKARLEWIYRGSTRLEPLYREIQAAGRQRQRAMPRPQALSRPNMPIVEYMRSDEQTKSTEIQNIKEVNNEELRRQRAVAKKSTATPTPPPAPNPTPMKLDSFYSRVVYYTPKNAVRPYKITANHVCGPNCGKRKDLLSLKELLTYNPLAKPLLSGWERQIVRSKYDKRVMYRAPCGRRIRNMEELLRYLQTIKSEMGVDLFDFGPNTHCLAEFVINKYVVSKKDLANGKENVPVPCVNFYDGSLPEFCAYSTERTPTAGVPLNLDPEFLCGCDCEDDCEDKTKCACWKLTLEGARTIGLEGEDVGYVYKRLPEPLRTGIYECNSRCKCKSTCLNRVVQHPLQLKLQVFKTPNRGWGIRALNDVPKGCFICIYVGNLLTDATANLDGLNEGDEYLAELDYIEVVEQTKEGYEEDIPESIKALDKKEEEKTSEESDGEEEEDEEEQEMNQSEDEEFKPVGLVSGVTQFNKRLRKRKKDEEKSNNEVKQETEKEGNSEEGCITISDDEEVREPSRFTASDGMGDGDFVSKHRSVRKLFGEDEACYIMDAKVQGNIGRYLNHSCCPNVFVQNVFVDTHDPRFPWVAFFASTHIKAGKELTWNYNYDIGSVPGKVLYCYCGEPNCRGRLL